jgi:outer membrane protein insertion porin family
MERKPNYVDLKLGLGHYQPTNQNLDLTTADFLLEWGNRNLNGTGRKMSLSMFSSYAVYPDPDFPVSADSIKNLLYRFNLRFVEPWLLGIPILTDLDFYYDPGVESVIQPYRIESYGGDLNFSKETSPSTKIWLTPSFQWVNIYNVSREEREEIKRERGINVRRKLILFAESDTRDNIFLPLRGSFTRLHAEFVGGFLGGDNHFFKLIFSWNRYFRLGQPGELDVLGTRLKLGYIEKLRSEEYVPTFDRFYMGGAATVRGYAENSMGPKDSEDKVKGGKVMILTNLELRRALFWKFGYTLFVDAGNLWFQPKHINLDELRMTAGFGIQFFTPVGPLRLDYAEKIIRKDDPKGGRLHLSILYAF